MEQRAQGAIEYLLIIGAAIIVVALVIILMSGILTGTSPSVNDANQSINKGYSDLNDVNF